MAIRLSLARVGATLGLLFVVLYVLCVAWDAIFPDWAMRSAWAGLLPGFDWFSVGNFLLGLVEVYAYGWILAVIFVPIWNALSAESARPAAR